MIHRLALIALIAGLLACSAAVRAVDVLTHHNDNSRTGSNPSETVLDQAHVTVAKFGKLYSRTVDGIMYAQPLYASALNIGGGTHNVVFVATMHNTIYAFDADNQNQAAYWTASMGASVPKAEVYTNGANDLYPEVGIVSTPVIDKSSNTMYVVAMTKDSANTYAHRLHALDLTTSAEKFGGPVVIAAPLFSSFRQCQRPGLLLANASIYFSFASFGDQTPYWGYVFRYNATTLMQQNVLNVNPGNVNGMGAGIWQGGCGAAADASGNVYVITGNCNSAAGRDAKTGGVNYSESALKFGSLGLAVTDFFMPADVDNIDGADLDFGGGGHVLLPDQLGSRTHVMVCAGKTGQVYVLDRDNMTHFAADNDARIIQKIGLGFNRTTPVFWQGPNGPRIFIQDYNSDPMISYAIAVDATKGYVQLTQDKATASGFQAVQRTVSSNGSAAGTGIVWTYSGTGADLVSQTTPVPATLRAFNAETLVELYNSGQNSARDALGGFAKYNTVTVANGKVYAPSTGNGSSNSISLLQVYGLLADNTPPAISTVSAVNSSTKVQIMYSKPVDPISATATANYSIDHGVSVSGAAISADEYTVTLSTSALSADVTYTLTVNNVKDLATAPNTIAANSQKTFVYQIEPPIVSITAPASGAAFTAPATYSISAAATAGPGASIAKVDFYVNGALIGTVTNAPYMLTLTKAQAGAYSLTVKATDNSNFSTTSPAVNIAIGAGSAAYGLDARAPVAAYLNGQLPPLSTGNFPATLSAVGAFTTVSPLTASTGLIPYSVNSPLWSDGALKTRWLAVPNAGSPYTADQQIAFTPTGEWTFPTGTVFVKHFELGTDDTNPSLTKRLETRFLVRGSDGTVYGVTYKWRPDNSDADLVAAAGLDEAVTIATATGSRSQTWHYPSRTECMTCHNANAGGVLGVKTRQLNGTSLYASSGNSDNQLRTFNHLGLFNPVIQESAISSYAKLVDVNDASAALDERFRSYIDSNCALCHRPGGANVQLDARYDTPLDGQHIVDAAVVNNLGLSGARVVVPQNVSKSILYQRVNLVGGTSMPPLAHNALDASANAEIAAWIGSLPALAITSIAPNQGVFNGGTPVTITGTNFGPGTTITFGANAATAVSVLNSTTLTCIAPASTGNALGAVAITGDDSADGAGTTTFNSYTYSARVPEFATAAGKIPGIGAKFFYNGTPVINAASGSAGPLTFDALLPYQGKVVAANALAGPPSSASPGTILNLVPANSTNFYAKITGYLKITTAGLYTISTDSDDGTLFYFGNTPQTTTLVVTNNLVQALTEVGGPAYLAAGLHQFTILYGQGGGGYGFSARYSGPDSANVKVVIPDAALFSDPAPVIASTSPASGSPRGNTVVTLTGSGFVAGANVTVSGIQASNINVASASSLSFTTPGGAAGTVNIVVVNPNGMADSITFTYDASVFGAPDSPANTTAGCFFRYYNLAGPTLPNFANQMPYRVGATLNASILPENTVAYPITQNDNHSQQLTGYISVPYSANWTFYTASDDGTILYIGAAPIVNNNFSQGITTRAGTLALSAGLHKFTLQFAQGGIGFGSYLGWGSVNPATIPLDTQGTNHAGAPSAANLIPNSAFFHVPPSWAGSGSGNWSAAANWNTDTGLGAFSPVQNDIALDVHESLVLRFPAVGNAPYTAFNDALGVQPLYVLELNSAIAGNTIAGHKLQFNASTPLIAYSGLAGATILQSNSGAATLSAPLLAASDLTLRGNGTGLVTLSGALANAIGVNLIKTDSSSFSLAGDASGFTQGTLALNAGTLGIDSILNATSSTVASGAALRGNGTLTGPVSVKGMVFPGSAASLLTNDVKGNLTLNSADFSVNGGTLRSRVWLRSASNLEADKLNIASTLGNALKLDASSTLDLRVQVPPGVVVVNNLDVEILHGGDTASNTYSAGFGNLTLSYGGSVTNMRVLYVNKDFVPNTGDTLNIIAGQVAGQPPSPAIAPNSYNRIFVRFNNAVTPVTLDSFTASPDGAGVLLEWTLQSEYQNAGFNLWRRTVPPFSAAATPAAADADDWQSVNPALLPGRFTNADPHTYRFYDWASRGNYAYRLESVSTQGVRAYCAQVSGVTLDGCVAVSAIGLDAAEECMRSERAQTRGLELQARLQQATDSPTASSATSTARIARIDRNTDPRVLSALGIAANGAGARAQFEAGAPELNGSGLVPRWFMSPPAAQKLSARTAAKVTYRDSGVMLVPQALLPAGFKTGALKIQREGRTLSALALTPGGLLLYGPGYADDYTDKDAFFLYPSNAPTPLKSPPPNAAPLALFAPQISALTSVPAVSTVQYHDVYFDWNLRPYDYPPWFSNAYLASGSNQSFTLAAPGAIPAASPDVLTVHVWSLTGGNILSGNPPFEHRVHAFINGQPAGDAAWDGAGMALALSFTLPPGALKPDGNTLELSTPQLPGRPPQIVLVNSISLAYTKALAGNAAREFVLPVSKNAVQTCEISNLPTNKLWVVDARFTDRASLLPCDTQRQPDGSFKARFLASAGGSGKFLVLPQGSENAPISVAPRLIRAIAPGIKYLAVGPKQFSAPLQPLLILRAREGLRAAFVDQEEVFDYYGFGRYGPEPIRKLVRSRRPHYLLLAGRTTSDYRNYSGANVDPLCPSFLTTTGFWAQTVGDAAFGDLGRGYPEISIGRFPAATPLELQGIVRHTLSYGGLSVSGWRGHLAADAADPDTGDFAADADQFSETLSDIAWTKNYLGVPAGHAQPQVTAGLKAAASGDADLIVYIGHGNASHLGKNDPHLATTDSVADWTGGVVLLQSTCTANWFANNVNGYQSIAAKALSQPQGGIVASIASTTYCTPPPALDFMQRLLHQATLQPAPSQPPQRWGDALLKLQQYAFRQSLSGDDASAPWYADLAKTECLLGDPALTIFIIR